jgi:hypothetical protein
MPDVAVRGNLALERIGLPSADPESSLQIHKRLIMPLLRAPGPRDTGPSGARRAAAPETHKMIGSSSGISAVSALIWNRDAEPARYSGAGTIGERDAKGCAA